jgi:hypothetical protein
VRGVPVERYGEADATLAYWGLGLHLGQAVSQNAAGDRLGHVRDVTGDAPRDPNVRLYKTRERLGFHTDGADVIGLLCLRPAKSGGTSRIASSAAIYNEILRRRPDLVATLYEPFPFDRNGEERPGEPPFFSIPLCAAGEDWLRTFYIGWYIRDSQRHPSAPRLTRAQREVIDLIDEIAADPAVHLDMELRAGDIQWLKNSVILHARTEYEDFPEPERKRHLLRLWLTSRRAFADHDAALNAGIARKDGAVSDALLAAIARSGAQRQHALAQQPQALLGRGVGQPAEGRHHRQVEVAEQLAPRATIDDLLGRAVGVDLDEALRGVVDAVGAERRGLLRVRGVALLLEVLDLGELVVRHHRLVVVGDVHLREIARLARGLGADQELREGRRGRGGLVVLRPAGAEVLDVLLRLLPGLLHEHHRLRAELGAHRRGVRRHRHHVGAVFPRAARLGTTCVGLRM